MNFLTNLSSESLKVFVNTFGILPVSFLFVISAMSCDSLLGVYNVKAMYVLGFVILFFMYYSIGSLLFPIREGEDGSSSGEEGGPMLEQFVDISYLKNINPFATMIQISFLSTLLSFTLSYFLSMNFLLKTKNVNNVAYSYLILYIMFCLFQSYGMNQSIQTVITSSAFGAIFGIAWAQLSLNFGLIDHDTTQEQLKNQKELVKKCSSTEPSSNDDMICKAFRM